MRLTQFKLTKLVRFCFVLAVFIVPQHVFAISQGALGLHIRQNLGQSLPITMIGPLVTNDVAVVETEAGFEVVIANASFADMQNLGDISFTMVPSEVDQDKLKVTNFNLPLLLKTSDGDDLPLTTHSLSGVWSLENAAYDSFEYSIGGLTLIDEDVETTMTSLTISLSPQTDAGVQRLKIDLGPMSSNDQSDGSAVVFDGLSAVGTVNTPELLRVHKVAGEMLDELSQTGIDILTDQKGMMSLISPLYVAYDSAHFDVDIKRIQSNQPADETKAVIKGITFMSNGFDMLQGQNGQSKFGLEFKGVDLVRSDNHIRFDTLHIEGATTQVDGLHAFDFGSSLLEIVEDDESLIDLADVFDLYFNFNDLNVDVSFTGLKLESSRGDDIEIERLGFGGSINGARSEHAAINLFFSLGHVDAGDMANDLLLSLKPDDTRIEISLDGIIANQIRQEMKGKNVPVALISGDEKALAEFMRNIGFQLLTVVLEQPPKILVQNSKVNTPTVDTKLEGSFDIAPLAEYMVAGTLNASITGLKDLQKAASKAMGTSKGRTRKIALGLVGGLGMAQGFGRRQDDGSLLYAIKLDEAGKITVNGLPIPNLPIPKF